MSAKIKINMVLVVCDSDDTDAVLQLNSTTTKTPPVNCSPRWIVYRNVNTYYGVRNTSATSQRQCLDSCAASSTCVSVSWFYRDKPPSCWMHYTHFKRFDYYGNTLFEIVRQCNLKSGAWRQRVFFYRVNISFDLITRWQGSARVF